MSGEALERAEARIKDLETALKGKEAKIETLTEALAGAHRVIQQQRDKDSIMPLDISTPSP